MTYEAPGAFDGKAPEQPAAPGVRFTVVIPARMASTRLQGKPLADIAGMPMVVRVAERAQQSGALRTVVAADDARILRACAEHGVDAIATRSDHLSGSDRLAEACALLGLEKQDIVVNVQGDEPLIDPQLIYAVAALLDHQGDASMGTAACPITSLQDFHNPNVVKVVLDGHQYASYFSRAPIPLARDMAGAAWWDGCAQAAQPRVKGLEGFGPLRHIGIYSYRAHFLRTFPTLPQAPTEAVEQLEQLRAIWHGHRIAVHLAPHAPGPGVDTQEDLERVRALFAQAAT